MCSTVTLTQSNQRHWVVPPQSYQLIIGSGRIPQSVLGTSRGTRPPSPPVATPLSTLICFRPSFDDVTRINFRFRLLVTWSPLRGRDASSHYIWCIYFYPIRSYWYFSEIKDGGRRHLGFVWWAMGPPTKLHSWRVPPVKIWSWSAW